MGRVFKGYEDGLKPQMRFMTDRAVIVQAWKKAHEYIRKRNWYSNTIDLDVSCAELDDLCEEIQQIFRGKPINFQPDPMRLIPAPKSASVDVKWCRKDGKRFYRPYASDGRTHTPSVRPLAHLSIRDQTISVMFLMTLANLVETEQGHAVAYAGKSNNHAVSYGNRLLCDWDEDGNASFRWGNAQTIDQYYNDYQAFVDRPTAFISAQNNTPHGRTRYYIVSLDLKRCYDHIKRKELIQKIVQLVARHCAYGSTVFDKLYFEFLERFFSIEWSNSDRQIVDWYQDSLNATTNQGCRDWANGIDGLPQGMVSSGMFANVYLMDFDASIRSFIDSHQYVEKSNIHIADYCRYVDDMRFVVVADSKHDEPNIGKLLAGHVQNLLDRYAPGQKLNMEKTKIVPVVLPVSRSALTDRIRQFKFEQSGPMTVDVAVDMLNIDAELWNYTEREKKFQSIVEHKKHCSDLTQVKDESIARMTVYNWHRAYKTLAVALPKADKDTDFSDKNVVNTPFEFDLTRASLDARTLDFCNQVFERWYKDPSQMRIFKLAIDLMPEKDKVESALDLLLSIPRKPKILHWYAIYDLSELYRAAAVEIWLDEDDDNDDRMEMARACRQVLSNRIGEVIAYAGHALPEFLANQLALFCIVQNLPERLPQILKKCSNGTRRIGSLIVDKSSSHCCRAGDFVVAHKLRPDIPVRLFEAQLRQLPLEEFVKVAPFFDDDELSSLINRERTTLHELKDGEQYVLMDVIRSHKNPFVNEVAAIRLMQALWQYFNVRARRKADGCSPASLQITCNCWKSLEVPCDKVSLTVSSNRHYIDEVKDPYAYMYKPEPWEDSSFVGLAKIGRLTRAALIGSADYSVMRSRPVNGGYNDADLSKYRRFSGVRSSWLKRRYGIHCDRRLMGGVYNSFSPWVSALLSSLLAWPGSRVEPGFESITMENLGKFLDERLSLLRKMYGQASGTLMLPVDVELDRLLGSDQDNECESEKYVNIAVVQALPPAKEDYKLLIDGTNVHVRARLRKHLSDVLTVLCKTFTMKGHVDPRQRHLNIVVFPELCVHPRDAFLLKRVADKFNCIIFFGETYMTHPYDEEKVINCGRWLIPQKSKDGDSYASHIELVQGKMHPTRGELENLGNRVVGFRPVQWLINGCLDGRRIWTLTASICYDATDIKLAADLRDLVDGYLVSAQNKDIGTFDAMAESLRYRMYNHVIIVNTANFGGSTIQAPYREGYKRVLMHLHGGSQPMVAIASMKLSDFSKCDGDFKCVKSPPAGYLGRSQRK